MIPRLVCAVEGPGDRVALPKLLFKVFPRDSVRVETVPVKRNRIVREGEIEKWVEAMLHKGDCQAVLVLLDSDDDAPCELGPELLKRAKAHCHRECRVVLAKREFEAWFVAGIESLRGTQGIAANAECDLDPEGISYPKRWLRSHMEGSRTYVETRDQAPLASRLDLDSARQRSDSLDKFIRDVENLAESMGVSGMFN